MKYQDLFNELHLFDESIKFDFYKFSDHGEIKSISEKIIAEIQRQNIFQNFSKKSQYKVRDYVKTLLCNFFVAFRTQKCVSIPRTKSYYSDHNNFAFSLISYDVFIFCVDFLTVNNYIGQKKGYKAFGDNTKGKTSKYWALPILYSQFNTLDFSDICTAKEKEIIMKDQNKNRVNFKGNSETKILRNKLQSTNELYQQFDFRTVLNSDRTTTRLFPRLTAIYNNCSLSDGGRLYCLPYRGINYQQLSKQERAKIQINLADTVQLDFSTLHLSMLYAQRNIELLSDPYSFDLNRNIAKKTILVLINAETEYSALKALEKEYKNTLDFKPIIAAAKKYHTPIADCFGSGIGIKLQNYDARIAVNVVSHFTAKGVPCLPIHDSFIVDKRYKEQLKDVMIYSYKMLFNGEIKVH